MMRDRGREAHEVKLNLTPMIDLTFLLVMFFVLTSAITSLNTERVVLPVALKAEEQSKEESTVLIINVKKTNDATREGEIRFNAKSHTQKTLTEALRLEVQFDGDRRGFETGPGGRKLSRLEVNVRPDRGVRGEYLRKVFMACQDVGIWKLKLSALQGEGDVRAGST